MSEKEISGGSGLCQVKMQFWLSFSPSLLLRSREDYWMNYHRYRPVATLLRVLKP